MNKSEYIYHLHMKNKNNEQKYNLKNTLRNFVDISINAIKPATAPAELNNVLTCTCIQSSIKNYQV